MIVGLVRAARSLGVGTVIWAIASGCGATDAPRAVQIDPAFARPDVNTTVLHLLVTERACASGRPMGDRLLGPQIVEIVDAVLIAFAAIPQGGGQDCQENPEAPVTVELASPLGERTLRDGRRIAIDITQLID